MSRALAGSCTVPLGAYAHIENGMLHMTGFVASTDGKEMVRDFVDGAPKDADALGRTLAQKLINHGADRILAALEHA